jgi:hypothetical protein
LWGVVGNEDEGQVGFDIDALVETEEIEDELDVSDSASPTETEGDDEGEDTVVFKRLDEPVEEEKDVLQEEPPDDDFVYEDLAD